ncbi:MAK10-like protein [Tanacetum coccineum]
MVDENPIRTLGDYSKPSHEGYRNTIELPVGNNVVTLRSETIRLVQNECSLHELRSEDPNHYLKDFLKLVDSLDLDASNWLERLPVGSITTWEDPYSILSTRKDRKTLQRYPDVRTTSWRISLRSMDSGKLRDRNAKESWALLEDLALYDNEIWNDPRDLAKLVKVITLPQDVPMNKITTSCEICSGPHDTQYCMKDPEQAFVEYASLCTDEVGDARLSKFEADFKQHKSDMTNKIDTVLKAITDRLAGSLPSDTVKNPKLSTFPVLSALSYRTIDPQCSSHPSTSINVIKAHSKEANISQTSLLQTEIGIEPRQLEEPEPTLEDEFQDLHLNLPVLEVLAHTPIYNALLDKYVESLELGKKGSTFVQGKVSAKMEDPGLFTLPCILGDAKPFDTLADLGSCVNIIPLYIFKKLNIGLLEETDHIFGLADGTKSYLVGIVKDVEVHIGKLKLLNYFYVINMKTDPETPLLVGRGFLATANAVIDCRMAKIAVEEGIIRLVLIPIE